MRDLSEQPLQVSDTQLWLVLPLLLRVLGDEEGVEFLEQARELVAKDPASLQRMVAVSARFELVDRLRADRIVRGQESYADREWQEIDQLASYLAATCIPIAQASPESSEQPFRAFLASLPAWTHHWLADCYILVPPDDPGGLDRWLALDEGVKVQEIADYFALLVARYPRTVDYAPWDWHDREHLPQAIREAAFEFTALHEDGDLAGPVELTVGVRKGWAEAEILRFLVVVSIRSQVGLDDSERVLEPYWQRRAFRERGLRLLKEIEGNLALLHRWCGRALHQRSPRADYGLLAGLDDQAAAKLAAEPGALVHDGQLQAGGLQAYQAAIQAINRRIDEFNARYSDPATDLGNKPMDEDRLFSSIVDHAETAELVARMEAIHRDLSRVLDSAG